MTTDIEETADTFRAKDPNVSIDTKSFVKDLFKSSGKEKSTLLMSFFSCMHLLYAAPQENPHL